jgi:hypothetical protein
MMANTVATLPTKGREICLAFMNGEVIFGTFEREYTDVKGGVLWTVRTEQGVQSFAWQNIMSWAFQWA